VGRVYHVSRPFNTGWLPLNYSGDPGVNGVSHRGGQWETPGLDNTYFNCSRALLLGGGRENTFYNNTVDGGDAVSPQLGVHFDNRGEGWDEKGCAPGGTQFEFLARVPYQSAAWAARYGPLLAKIKDDDICKPKCEFRTSCPASFQEDLGLSSISRSLAAVAAAVMS